MIVIPLASAQGGAQVTPGAASAFGTLGTFVTSSGFMVLLVLVIIGLVIYLLATSKRAELNS